MKKFLSVLFIIIGLLFFISTVITMVKRSIFLFNSTEMVGTVVSFRKTIYEPGDGRKIPEQYPIIEYNYNSKKYKFESNNVKNDLIEGDQVKIRVDIKNPSSAIIAEGFSDKWGGVIALFFFGFVFSIVGGMNYYLRR